jgi:hypothetical protein
MLSPDGHPEPLCWPRRTAREAWAARPIEGFVESIPGRFRGRRWTAFTSGKLLQFTLFADQKLLRL